MAFIPAWAFTAISIAMTAYSMYEQSQQEFKNDPGALADQDMTVSAYGQPVPRLFGTVAVAGNVFWRMPNHVVPTTTEESAKGGGTIENTTYAYYARCAILLGEGEIAGVSRIWANGKIIYDMRSTSSVESIAASQRVPIRIYTGSADQLPDPLIESDKGVGNVPAWRGRAYVVLDHFDVTEYGGTLPSFKFEVVQAGGMVTQSSQLSTLPVDYSICWENWIYGRGDGYVDVASWYRESGKIGVRIDRVFIDGTQVSISHGGFVSGVFNPSLAVFNKNQRLITLRRDDAMNGSSIITTFTFWGEDETTSVKISSLYDSNNSGFYQRSYTFNDEYLIGAVFSGTYQWTSVKLFRFNNTSGQFEQYASIGCPYNTNAQWRFYIDGDYAYAWMRDYKGGSFSRLARISFINGSFETLATVNTTDGYGEFVPYSGGVVLIVSSGDGNITILDLSGSVIETWVKSGENSLDVHRAQYLWEPRMLVRLPYDYYALKMIRIYAYRHAFQSEQVKVSDVVETLLLDRGIDTDASAVTDTLAGYRISQQQTTRQAVEPLQNCYGFDMIETEAGGLKAVPRGQSPVDLIQESGLIGRLQITRAQEVELPKEVNVNYLSANADYQSGSQRATRQCTKSDQISTITVPVVLTDDQGAQVADIMLREAWQSRTSYKMVTARDKYAWELCDVVQVQTDTALHTIRLVSRNDNAGKIEWEGIADDAATYTSSATGTSIGGDKPSLELPGPTRFEILDLPPLRDSDDNYGLYWAACGYKDAWRGCALYRTLDGGKSWINIGAITAPCAIGTGDAALGDWTGGNVVDEANTITVSLLSGELASVNNDLFLAGSNAALIGNEIVYYRDAVLVGTKQYRLSGLMRGRLATPSTGHASGDRFIRLDGNLRTIDIRPEDFGQTLKYEVVGYGESTAGGDEKTITVNNAHIVPLPVYQLRAIAQPSKNINIDWIRQARINYAWRDYIDVPVDDIPEAYRIRIYDGSTLKREAATTAASFIYTAAMASADGLTGNKTLSIRVSQKSNEGLYSTETAVNVTITY